MTSSRMKLTNRHYKTVAKWIREISLVFLASLVIRNIVEWRVFLYNYKPDPVVLTGTAVSFFLYVLALHLLLKS